MELWDAYDAHLNNIDGQTLVRGEKIPKGLYHLVCEIIVRHQDGMYLLTQRDERKNFGGMWEATVGGSALKGESPLLFYKMVKPRLSNGLPLMNYVRCLETN